MTILLISLMLGLSVTANRAHYGGVVTARAGETVVTNDAVFEIVAGEVEVRSLAKPRLLPAPEPE